MFIPGLQYRSPDDESEKNHHENSDQSPEHLSDDEIEREIRCGDMK